MGWANEDRSTVYCFTPQMASKPNSGPGQRQGLCPCHLMGAGVQAFEPPSTAFPGVLSGSRIPSGEVWT